MAKESEATTGGATDGGAPRATGRPPRGARPAASPWRLGALAAVLGLLVGCRPSPPTHVVGDPAEVLVVVAGELRRLRAYDAYHRPPPIDLSGVHADAAALIRLENHERLHPDRLPDVVAFLQGEALLGLRDYERAMRAYDRAAAFETEVRPVALARRALAAEIATLARWPADDAPAAEMIRLLDARRAALRARAATARDRPARTLLDLEAEQADVDWARAITLVRPLWPDGIERMTAAWEEVIARHPGSHRRHRHRLALAECYDLLAAEYLEANPTATLRFAREELMPLADRARSLYLEVAQADGFEERLVGRARLEALNARIEEALRHAP